LKPGTLDELTIKSLFETVKWPEPVKLCSEDEFLMRKLKGKSFEEIKRARKSKRTRTV